MEQVSNTIEKIKTGTTGKWTQKPNGLISNSEPTKLRKPLVIPHEIPDAILSKHLLCSRINLVDDAGYQVIAGHLWAYQYSNIGWDEFAKKIDSVMRDLMAKIFRDCRQNGFFAPVAFMRKGKKIIMFGQVVERDRKVPVPDILKPDLCYFCERKTCEDIDKNGNPIKNRQHCWR